MIYNELQWPTMSYSELQQSTTMTYKKLQWVTMIYNELERPTMSYNDLQKATMSYKIKAVLLKTLAFDILRYLLTGSGLVCLLRTTHWRNLQRGKVLIL